MPSIHQASSVNASIAQASRVVPGTIYQIMSCSNLQHSKQNANCNHLEALKNSFA